MRGVDHQQGGMFSYLSPEERVRQDHPLRSLSNNRRRGSGGVLPVVRRDVFGDRPAVDSAGEVVASAAAADAVLYPK